MQETLTGCMGSSSSFFLFLLRMAGRGFPVFMFLAPRMLALRLAAILKIAKCKMIPREKDNPAY